MKQIKNFLFEATIANQVDNIIISGSGSMHTIVNGAVSILRKTFKNANLYVYDTNADKVVPLADINKFKASGSHNDKLSGVAKFYEDHIGETTIFIQN